MVVVYVIVENPTATRTIAQGAPQTGMSCYRLDVQKKDLAQEAVEQFIAEWTDLPPLARIGYFIGRPDALEMKPQLVKLEGAELGTTHMRYPSE